MTSRDFFVVGARLAPDPAHPSTNDISTVSTTVHKTQPGNPDRLVTIIDWLIKTLQNSPQLLLRIARRRVLTGSGALLLDFGAVGKYLVLVGDVDTLPEHIPQLTISVIVAGVNDAWSLARHFTSSLQDCLWEHVLVAMDAAGGERSTCIYILTETSGTVPTLGLSKKIFTSRVWSREGENNHCEPDRVMHYSTLKEALQQRKDDGDETEQNGATTDQTPASVSLTSTNTKKNTAAGTGPPKGADKNAAKPTDKSGAPKQASSNKPAAPDKPAVNTPGAVSDANKTKQTSDKLSHQTKAKTMESNRSETPVKDKESKSDSNATQTPKPIVPQKPDAVTAHTKKKQKDPNKPKRAKTAYNYFFAECMTRLRAEHPGEDIGIISKLAGAEWKELSAKDKAKFEKMAETDKDRRDEQMRGYAPPVEDSSEEMAAADKDRRDKQMGVSKTRSEEASDNEDNEEVIETPKDEGSKQQKRTKKKEKDPNKPKKAMSAYLFYSSITRPQVKKDNPDLPFGELSKKVSENYKALTAREKEVYEKLAERDKDRFSHEIAQYDASKNSKGIMKDVAESEPHQSEKEDDKAEDNESSAKENRQEAQSEHDEPETKDTSEESDEESAAPPLSPPEKKTAKKTSKPTTRSPKRKSTMPLPHNKKKKLSSPTRQRKENSPRGRSKGK